MKVDSQSQPIVAGCDQTALDDQPDRRVGVAHIKDLLPGEKRLAGLLAKFNANCSCTGVSVGNT